MNTRRSVFQRLCHSVAGTRYLECVHAEHVRGAFPYGPHLRVTQQARHVRVLHVVVSE